MKYFSAPLEVGLDVTNQCNLKCMHCYASSTLRKAPNELTLEEMQNLVDQLVQMKVFRLFLGGGEPFISLHNPQSWERVCDVALLPDIRGS